MSLLKGIAMLGGALAASAGGYDGGLGPKPIGDSVYRIRPSNRYGSWWSGERQQLVILESGNWIKPGPGREEFWETRWDVNPFGGRARNDEAAIAWFGLVPKDDR